MTTALDRHFLVVRDRLGGGTTVDTFADAATAYPRYTDAEARLSGTGSEPVRWDVLLISADSIESVRALYPQYFADEDTQSTVGERKLLGDLLHAM